MKLFIEDHEFEIANIQWLNDDNFGPTDIVIRANPHTLEKISEWAMVGCNIQALPEDEAIRYGVTHEALYAQLPPFGIKDYHKVVYKY